MKYKEHSASLSLLQFHTSFQSSSFIIWKSEKFTENSNDWCISKRCFLLTYLSLLSEMWLIKTLADQISVYSEFYYALDKNPHLFFKYRSFQTPVFQESCLEAHLSADSKITSFQRLLDIYSHQFKFGATAQIMSFKSTCESALCCTSFMICHPGLKFTLSLSNVIKWEEGLWAKLFKAVSYSSTELRLAKNSGTVVAPAHLTQLWELF